MVKTFHREGFNIILHYNRSEEAAQELQTQLCSIREDSVRLLQLDLVNCTDWDGVVTFCQDQWGRLDVLINNASSFYPTRLGQIEESDWDDLVGTNLKAPFFLCQALAPALRENAGTIVNIVDIHASRPLKNYSVYSVAKAGLIMLTRSLAKELAPEVRVNAIAPGAILWPENKAELTDQTRANIIRQIPLKRQGAPEDVAKTALFLATTAPYINGQILAVDGGRSLS
jgi:pteridine reductase